MSEPKTWNWQQADWPHFRFDPVRIEGFEAAFLRESGVFTGALRHVGADDKEELAVELMGDEAFSTSEIEGEILNRDSLQSSIRRNFGLATDNRKTPPAEQGIAEMMVNLYRRFDEPLTHEHLFEWHRMLMNGRRDMADVGRYRSCEAPMQVVSGPLHAPKIHFEGPPSADVPREMEWFVAWFQTTSHLGSRPLPILARAGIAHLYFVSIHPFEDGNGRIGRALVEKVISEGLGQPTLLALSETINHGRKAYYEMLEASNKDNEITPWLTYFAETIVKAQARAQQKLDFLIAKTRFHDRHRGQLNERQAKAIDRMMREGPDGFKGGLSAENYISITGTGETFRLD